MSTSEEEKSLLTRSVNNRLPDQTIDQYLTMMCLERTIGQVAYLRETATNAKQYWAASLIFDAVFEKDIGLINQIATRVDGTVPNEKDRDKFANLVGEAIDDVMEYTNKEQCIIKEDDLCIIAIAKAIWFISTDHPGKNQSKKKEKQQAVDMILSRTGGRKVEPVKELTTTRFVQPDWMSLPGGQE